MKKAIFIGTLIMALVILASAVYSISVPLPVVGKIVGCNPGNLVVNVQNTRTGEIQITTTTHAGEWLVDWANAKESARPGDTFKVTVEGISEQVTWDGEPTVYIEIKYDAQAKECVCESETDWMKVGAGAVMALIVSLVAFMGGGLKIYKNRIGNMTIQHRHKGIKAYHDPNVLHMNPLYSHRRWKDNPLGCAKDVKKIEAGGLI